MTITLNMIARLICTFLLLCQVFGGASTYHTKDGLEKRVNVAVQTDSGLVQGHAAPQAPAISEYLGIPYAKPPVGELRFTHPQRYYGDDMINGTNFGFSCPISSTYTEQLRPRPEAGLNFTAAGVKILEAIAQVGERFSEDCLTLNIWTKHTKDSMPKAVMLWIHGGGYVAGSSNAPTYHGARLADQEDVVVVSINYRINILGFPGVPGFANLGLLDQRLAIEWVRDNIAAFGGDPTRITIFGESAGGGSVDLYSYAWASDPIVAGLIAQSGTVQVVPPNNATSGEALWVNATLLLGCAGNESNATNVIGCMRTKSVDDISKIISRLPNFVPTIDEKVVFSDYSERSLAGNFIQKPMIVGHNDYEGGMVDIVARLRGLTTPRESLDAFDLETFFCPAAARANVSVSHSVPIWRYRYFGDFPNMDLSTTIETGAYHGAEVNILFDTVPQGHGIPESSPAEVEIGKLIRGVWAAFAKDPYQGLDSYSWPRFDPMKETLARLGFMNSTRLSLTSPASYDAPCGAIFPVATAEQ